MVHITLEIAATPKQVRETVLDFPRYADWHASFIQNIETVTPDQNPRSLVNGNQIRADLDRAKGFIGTILRNDEEELRWYGSTMLGAFAGQHYFRFEESKEKPGYTRFSHGEDYTGWMTWLFSEGRPMHGMVVEMFGGYSRDLKKRCEELREREQV